MVSVDEIIRMFEGVRDVDYFGFFGMIGLIVYFVSIEIFDICNFFKSSIFMFVFLGYD